MKELGDFLKKASEFEAEMKKVQADLDKQRIVGVSGGGLVKVEMNGRHDVSNVVIDERLMDDREALEDLVAGAINDAVRRVEDASHEKMANLTAGVKLPIANWPA